jgi:hypothetical protein
MITEDNYLRNAMCKTVVAVQDFNTRYAQAHVVMTTHDVSITCSREQPSFNDAISRCFVTLLARAYNSTSTDRPEETLNFYYGRSIKLSTVCEPL